MIALIQRVSAADVVADGEPTGSIGRGLLLLLGVQKEDTSADVVKLLQKTLNYRIFPDEKNETT